MSGPRVHGFLFYQVPPGYRTSQAASRVLAAVDRSGSVPGVAAVYTYGLVGLRADVDLGLWVAAHTLDAYQAAVEPLLATDLRCVYALWGFVRPSQYTGRSGTSVQVPGPRKRYLVVYPFTKTHEWYQLPAEDRRRMMLEHARVGHGFEGIEQILLYTTGLSDWEFVVGYETDDPEHFLELVTSLRTTAARPYTLRDTPIFTARYGTPEEVVRHVFHVP
ncbi:MAG: chlorite dismutase family protein [Armatimonadota bacterium]|nr:chlorite dismutase family protein [Armatimonadota bacterium]MDW8154987.1 chlorite dismutase family protein [Armatimonadota bacterium]